MQDTMLERLMLLIPLVLSLTVHEWAHAISAYKLGDDTAARQGRLTLNPVAHIDPFGTLLLPLLGVPFGWARPVPVVPSRFRRDVNMRTGMMLTSVAGPASNVVLAFLCFLGLAGILRFAPGLFVQHEGLYMLLQSGASVNIALAVFNMLPVPPLDGSRVVEGLIPYQYRDGWEKFARVAPIILMVLIIMPGRMPFIDVPMHYLGAALKSAALWMARII